MQNQIETLDTEEFRRICAGLVRSRQEAGDPLEMKQTGVALCLLLAEVFSDKLDRLTLWSRISTALKTARANTDSGDADRFLQLCLDHVKADTAQTLANPRLTELITILSEKSAEWLNNYFRYLDERAFVVVALARVAWENRKENK